jgi:hypothetical protein
MDALRNAHLLIIIPHSRYTTLLSVQRLMSTSERGLSFEDTYLTSRSLWICGAAVYIQDG